MDENKKQKLLKYDGHLLGLQETNENVFEIINQEFKKSIDKKREKKEKKKKAPPPRPKLNKYPEILVNKLLSRLKALNAEGREIRTIKSFSFVCTAEVVREASILVVSLRQFHDQPIYVTCDAESKRYLEEEGSGDLYFDVSASKIELAEIKDKHFKEKFKNIDTFHKAECIYKKMECMERAIEKYGNTFFLDADIIVVDSLQEEFTKDLALSPHYHPLWKSHMTAYCGIFNAGYVFCCDKKFPQLWRDLYLNDSSFYEQECMNYFCEHYDIDIIPASHNVGFWRDKAPNAQYDLDIQFNTEGLKRPKSFHVHILNEMDFKNNHIVKIKNAEMSNLVMDYIYKHCSADLYKYIKSKAAYTKKTAFIHFGKCAGVYVNQYMRNNVLHAGVEINSWSIYNPLGKSLNRDWTQQELIKIAKNEFLGDSPPDCQLAHNHHINWSDSAITEFKNNNWFTFTFIRNPKDLICSLYFYAKKCAAEMGPENNPMAGEIEKLSKQLDPELVSLQDFVYFCLTDPKTRRLWVLPEWIGRLDYVAEFNDKNFAGFLKKYYSHSYVPGPRSNTSANKGFNHYVEMGEISPDLEHKLENDPEYKRYLRYLDQV